MSRALIIDSPRDHVLATCAELEAAISSIETLPGGATRVVLCSKDGAGTIERRYAKKIVRGPVERTPLTLATRGVPLSETLPSAPPAAPRTRSSF